jgi:hypothetical protein
MAVPDRVGWVEMVVVQRVQMRRIAWAMVVVERISAIRSDARCRRRALDQRVFLASVNHHDCHQRCKKQEFLHKDLKVKNEYILAN